MLQSEFEERTNLHLTPEEYKEVEDMYVSVTMDKDEFCKQWLALKDNKLVKELYDVIKFLRRECKHTEELKNSLESEYVSLRTEKEFMEVDKEHEFDEKMKSFGDKILMAMDNGVMSEIYDAVKEALGIDYVIKSKYKQGIPLGPSEIEYLVSKIDE